MRHKKLVFWSHKCALLFEEINKILNVSLVKGTRRLGGLVQKKNRPVILAHIKFAKLHHRHLISS